MPYSIPTGELQSRIDRLIDAANIPARNVANQIASQIKQDPDWRAKVIWRYSKKHS